MVCHALTTALAKKDVRITYVMPTGPTSVSAEHVRLLVASRLVPAASLPGVTMMQIEARLSPYASLGSMWREATAGGGATALAEADDDGGDEGPLYGPRLLGQVERFAARLEAIAPGLDFDLIHAHDWTTFPAGLAVKRLTGKPLIVHVHITEFDKTGGAHADPETYAIEREGMHGADLVVAVSHRVKDMCVGRYGVDPDRVAVVHNGVESWEERPQESPWRAAAKPRGVKGAGGGGKVVLFLGRVTLQKGPDYFVDAARRVLDVDPDVTFIVAGSGDMLPRTIERSAEAGIGSKMLFAGFVTRDEALRLYRMADLYVMPSVSEPFGVAPLEAMTQGVPVIVSRQSGVAEVLQHAIKVDFWDVEALAGKILAALSYPTLARQLKSEGRREAARLNWDAVADRVMDLYRGVIGSHHRG